MEGTITASAGVYLVVVTHPLGQVVIGSHTIENKEYAQDLGEDIATALMTPNVTKPRAIPVTVPIGWAVSINRVDGAFEELRQVVLALTNKIAGDVADYVSFEDVIERLEALAPKKVGE